MSYSATRFSSRFFPSRRLALLLTVAALTPGAPAHEGLVAAHSPPAPNLPGACPTLAPLQLFAVPDPRLGDPIEPGATGPAHGGTPTTLARIALSAILARPEFGGFVYTLSSPGLDYIDPANPCHALTTAFTGGRSFVMRLDRIYWPDGVNFALADPFGGPQLLEDGDSYAFGTDTLSHVHPLWLARRAGRYHATLGFSSDFFLPSDPFSVTFKTPLECFTPVAIDLRSAFNADLVDSDAADAPVSMDAAGRAWLLNGHLGAHQGLPRDGRLDVFELGGPGGTGLHGALPNALFDNGSLTSAATIDLVATGQAGTYESLEILLAAAGTFTSADSLIARMNYAGGSQQTVNIRRAATLPRYTPLADWQLVVSPRPHLAVGRSGTRDGGGFVRSSGSAIDTTPTPPDSIYFQRVTFPVDAARELRSIRFDDYAGAGRVAVFAITAIRTEACPNGDFNRDGSIDGLDFAALPACWTGPASTSVDATCRAFDIERDSDVDLGDFAEFQQRFGAPAR